jgi:hypothetical protein
MGFLSAVIMLLLLYHKLFLTSSRFAPHRRWSGCGLTGKEIPRQLIDVYREARRRHNQLQPLAFKTYLFDQPLGISDAFPGAHIPFPIMACPFGTGDDIYFVGPGFECAHKVERIDAAAARQWEKPYSVAKLPFKSASIDVLIWVYLVHEVLS